MNQNIPDKIRLNGIWQITVCSILLFVFPVFHDDLVILLTLIGLLILLFVSASMINKHRNTYFIIAVLITISRLTTRYFQFKVGSAIGDLSMVIFFAWIAITLAKQMIEKEAGLDVIIEAIAGYLLLGISLTLIMGVILYFSPGSFSFFGTPMEFRRNYFPICSYFVFITFTTTGYGDIVPINDFGRAFAKLTALCGQIYLSVIITILIGKYLQKKF